MKTFKFKRSLSAATAAIMTLSVMTGVVPGVVNKFAGNVEMSVSVEATGSNPVLPADDAWGIGQWKGDDFKKYYGDTSTVEISQDGTTTTFSNLTLGWCGRQDGVDRPYNGWTWCIRLWSPKGSDKPTNNIYWSSTDTTPYNLNDNCKDGSGTETRYWDDTWLFLTQKTIKDALENNDGKIEKSIFVKSADSEHYRRYTAVLDVKNITLRDYNSSESSDVHTTGHIQMQVVEGNITRLDGVDLAHEKPEAKTNLVFNDAEQELITGKDGLTYAVTAVGENPAKTAWSTTVPKKKEAGTYRVWYRKDGNVGGTTYSDGNGTPTYSDRAGKSGYSRENYDDLSYIDVTIAQKSSHSVDYETVTEDGVTYYVYSDRAEAAEVDTSIKSAVIKSKVGGENVTAIGENAFNSCAVETVTIPETVTEIRNSAFWGCSALKKITIPKTVGYIGKDAFKRCSALEEISGYTGSAAETFAKSSNIKFVPLDGAVTTVSSTEVTVESTTTATTTTAVVTDKVKPGAPTNVKVDKNGNVTWDAADNAAYYKIVKVVKEKGVEKSYGVVVKDGTSGKISVPASDYRVYVAAFASNGSKTNSASVQVKVDKPLGYVNDPTVDAEGNVTFTAAENAVNYKIGKIVNGKTYYSKEFSGTTGTIKVPKTDYKIFVVAIDKNGKKTWGKIVDVELPLGTVTDPKVSSDGKVTWSAVRGAVSYKVGKKYTNSKGKAATGYTSLITDGKTEANIKLMKGENKVFVVAFDKDGNKTWGSKVTVVKE